MTPVSAPDLAAAKAHIWSFVSAVPGPAWEQALAQHLAVDAAWAVFHPINELTGPQAVAAGLYAPLLRAMPDLERRTDMFFGGHWPGQICGGEGWWCTVVGHYMGTLVQPWLGVPPTGKTTCLRFGEFYRWFEGRIVEARVLLDIVDFARQAGVALLSPSPGADLLVPGPRPHNGLLRGLVDPAEGALSMQRTLAMFAGLSSFDGKDLNSMGMERFWHPHMMWYGPCGIGSARGIRGFQDHHQRPFLHAFPDRVGANHRARFAEGPFVASTGWPSVTATHAGSYLGVPASGRAIGMRVADWWRCDDSGLLAENWVLIDLPHLLLQMGVDLLAPLGARPV